MCIAKCKHLTCMQEYYCLIKLICQISKLNSLFKDEFTSKWVNFWMSSKGMAQSLVIVQHAKSLQIPIFKNFNSIYKFFIKDYFSPTLEEIKLKIN